MTYKCRICREEAPELESDNKGSLECGKCHRLVPDPGWHDIEVKIEPRAIFSEIAPSHGLGRKEMLAQNAYIDEEAPEFPLGG